MAMRASYRRLLIGGELERRAEALERLAQPCQLCPRRCGVQRVDGERGDCGAGEWPSLISSGPHHGEEPCLSGMHGSGTLFFGHCNLQCVFCQNSDISQDHRAAEQCEVDPGLVAHAMLHLQRMGCHNINWVSPTHCIAGAVRALVIAAEQGLRLPIVHNSNGYDSVEALRLLDGIVDIYMPDLKFADDEIAILLCNAPDYIASAREALLEMHRQVGDLVMDEHGIAERGLLIRHLVLPHDLAGTEATLTWIAEHLGRNVTINLMAQYHPAHRAMEDPRLARRLTRDEYRTAVDCAHDLGLQRVMTQGWI